MQTTFEALLPKMEAAGYRLIQSLKTSRPDFHYTQAVHIFQRHNSGHRIFIEELGKGHGVNFFTLMTSEGINQLILDINRNGQ